MKTTKLSALCGFALCSSVAGAGDLTTNAAIGGAVGGAIGGAVGAELGGREGAILGAGVGAAAGTAINTKEHATTASHPTGSPDHHVYHGPHGRFCPPGQAKKGRC